MSIVTQRVQIDGEDRAITEDRARLEAVAQTGAPAAEGDDPELVPDGTGVDGGPDRDPAPRGPGRGASPRASAPEE